MGGADQRDNRKQRRTWLWLGLLVLSALAIRSAFAAVQYGRITQDGVMYMDMARGILAGSAAQAFHEQGTLLYPALTALFHLLIPNIEAAALSVSVLLSSLMVVPTFFLGRFLAGAKLGGWAALFVALSPTLNFYGARVLAEGTFVFFLVLAAVFGCSLVSRIKPWTALGFGLIAGTAYLARQEVLLLVALTVAAVLATLAWRRYRGQDAQWRRGLAVTALVLVGFFPFVGVQVTGLYLKTGHVYLFSKGASVPPISPAGRERYNRWRWTLTADQKHLHKDVMLQPQYARQRPHLAEPPGRWLRYWCSNVGAYLADAPKVIGFVAVPFALVGFLGALAGRRRSGGRYLAVFILAYLLCLGAGYPTRRFFVALVPFALVLAADGVVSLPSWCRRWWPTTGQKTALAAVLAVAVLLTAQTAHKWWAERGKTYEYQGRAVGTWMRANVPPGPLMTRRARLPFYSGFPYVPLPVGAPYDALLRYADYRQVRYIVVDVPDHFEERPRSAWDELLADPAWRQVHIWPWSEPGTEGKMVLLEWLASSAGGPGRNAGGAAEE